MEFVALFIVIFVVLNIAVLITGLLAHDCCRATERHRPKPNKEFLLGVILLLLAFRRPSRSQMTIRESPFQREFMI